MTAAALAALLVVSATPQPSFETFAKGFPELKLPAAFPAEGKPIAAAEAMAFVIAPPVARARKSPLPPLPFASDGEAKRRAQTLELMKDPNAEGALQFTAVGRLPLSGAVGLVVRRRLTMMMGSEDLTVLLTYTPQGAFLASMTLGDRGASEAGGTTISSTVSASLEVALETEDVMPLHDVEGVDQLTMKHTSTATITPQGAITEQPSTWGSVEGAYQDPKSHELLLLSASKAGVRAWYRAKDEAPPQKLTVVRDTDHQHQVVVRFPKSPKEYVLTAPAGFANLSCKIPDGTVQRFERSR